MLYLDAEDIFADADSIDAANIVPRRPGVGFLNAIQISDDEMDAVRIKFNTFNQLTNETTLL